MTTYVSAQTGKRMIETVILCFAVMMIVVVYVGCQGYESRDDFVTSQRAGCERGKLDRMANAKAWRIAVAARKADGDFTVANQYAEVAAGLEERGRIDCNKAFPKASLIP
jgi:hypothetical protein